MVERRITSAVCGFAGAAFFLTGAFAGFGDLTSVILVVIGCLYGLAGLRLWPSSMRVIIAPMEVNGHLVACLVATAPGMHWHCLRCHGWMTSVGQFETFECIPGDEKRGRDLNP